MRGPINPSLNEMCGPAGRRLRHRPDAADAAQPAGVCGVQIEAAGYRKVKDLFAWIYDAQRELPPVFARPARRLRDKHGITMRPLRPRRSSRAKSSGCARSTARPGSGTGASSPPTTAEFRRIANELKPIFDPRCAVCAEVDGAMVACVVAVPDINQALKGTNGRLLPLGLIRVLLRASATCPRSRLLLLGIDERLSHGSASIPLLARPLAPAAARARRTARRVLVGARGQSRHQSGRQNSPGRAATRPIASTRRRCRDAARRGHRRLRVHRRATSSTHLGRAATDVIAGAASVRAAALAGHAAAASTRSSISPAWCRRCARRDYHRRQRRRHARWSPTRARTAGVALVHISSLAAAGSGGHGQPRSRRRSVRRRSTPYGRSKLEGENARHRASRRPAAGQSLRPGVVYGPRDRGAAAAVRAARRAASLPLVGRARRGVYVHPRRGPRARDRRRRSIGPAGGETLFVGASAARSRTRELLEGVRAAVGARARSFACPWRSTAAGGHRRRRRPGRCRGRPCRDQQPALRRAGASGIRLPRRSAARSPRSRR